MIMKISGAYIHIMNTKYTNFQKKSMHYMKFLRTDKIMSADSLTDRHGDSKVPPNFV